MSLTGQYHQFGQDSDDQGPGTRADPRENSGSYGLPSGASKTGELLGVLASLSLVTFG